MNLCYWNVVVGGEVEHSTWGSPWLCTVERAIQVASAPELRPDLQIWPTAPQDLSLIEQVKAYARAHYNTGGWDVIVECWDDEQIAEALSIWDDISRGKRSAATIEEALTHSALSVCVEVWADRQADAAVNGCTGDKFCSYHASH